MKKISLVVIASLIIPTVAQAIQQVEDPVCFSDSYGVKRHSPDAYPSWTYNMPGHKGEKCWFPASKENKKWHPVATKTNKVKDEAKEIKRAQIESKNTNKVTTPSTRAIVIDPPLEIKVIEQPIIAKTNEWSVAYRFEAYADKISTDRFMQWAGSLF